MRFHGAATVAVLLLSVTLAHAQAQNAPPSTTAAPTTAPGGSAAPAGNAGQTSSAQIPQADRSFARAAARAGTAEINAAQIALQKSHRQDVKAFAEQMVQDHTKLADQLKTIASSKGLTLPTRASRSDRRQAASLRKLTGAAFDRSYIEGQRKAHQQAVALFSKESKEGQDRQLQSFASQSLPILQHHLQMAEALPLTPQTSSNPQ